MNKSQILYQHAKEFILSHQSIIDSDLNKLLKPELRRTRPTSLAEINFWLLTSAQNVQSSPNVIGKIVSGEKGNIIPLGKSIYDFDPHLIHSNFKNHSAEELFDEIDKDFKIREKTTGNTIWIKYCKTIKSAANFFVKFPSHKEFYEFINQFLNSKETRPFLPMKFKFEIFGIGFALACDFLKELGYDEFSKPDTHTKDILFQTGFLNDIRQNSLEADYFTILKIEEIAKLNKVTPYEIDKILWLIGSGKFYLSGKKIENRKLEFIDSVNLKFNGT